MIKMNSNYVLYTDEERKIIDEMQMEENKQLFLNVELNKASSKE